jgi:hypothetical protein
VTAEGAAGGAAAGAAAAAVHAATGGAAGLAEAAAAVEGLAPKSAAGASREIVITPPQTEQRARTLSAGSLSGSTRNTERHSGHTTFMPCLPSTRQVPGP